MTDAVEQATGNPYLLGNYAPVADEKQGDRSPP